MQNSVIPIVIHCYLNMDAFRALVFRPLVKRNKALGTRVSWYRLGIKNEVLVPLWVFMLKRSTTGAFPVPLILGSRAETYMTEDNVLF